MNLSKTKLTLTLLVLTGALLCNNLYAKPGKGERRGPPQEAIDACVDKSDGDIVTFTTPHGDELTGVCRTMKEMLIAVPEGHEEGNNSERPERPKQ